LIIIFFTKQAFVNTYLMKLLNIKRLNYNAKDLIVINKGINLSLIIILMTLSSICYKEMKFAIWIDRLMSQFMKISKSIFIKNYN